MTELPLYHPTRRGFLAGTGGMALLAMLEGCTPELPDKASDDPYGQALRLLREAVQASPDHLARRADDAVATKNAEKIITFVRDHVSVVPPWSKSEDPLSARRWGTSVTLRGGQGTLRERADLTAELLTKAGFNARVKIADRPASLDQAALYRPRPIDFVPDQKRVDHAVQLFGSVGVPKPAAAPSPPAEPDPVAAILDALSADAKQLTPREDLLPAAIPVVTYEENGETKYAFTLGDTKPDAAEPAGLADAPDAAALPTVAVKVSAMANPAPGSQTPRGQLIDLVSGEWTTDVVVGRQLLLTFVPQAGPKAMLTTKAADMPVRIPLLRVQTDAPPGPPEFAKSGPMISVQGDVITEDSTGQLTGPFGPVTVLSKDATKAAIDRAATIQISAVADAFPEVRLQVAVLDSAGAPIDGLDATSFAVTDNGAKVSSLTLQSNSKSPNPPRVLLAYDTSASVTWPTPAAQSAFENALASTLTQVAAKTPIETQVLGLGTSPAEDGWKAPTTDNVIDGLHAAGASSAVWTSVGGDSLDAGPTAIVVVSDFAADDDPEAIPGYQQRLAGAGVPVFCLPIGDVDTGALSKVVALSGGGQLDPKDPALADKLATLIKPLAAKRAAATYRMSHLAPAAEPAEHSVSITLTGRAQPSGTATYRVPERPVTPPSLVGLYATITVNGVSTIRRLAGVPINDSDKALTGLDDPTAAAETRAAMYGITTLAFEPGTTTNAAILDDVLSTYISVDPVRRIWKDKPTADQIVQAAGTGLVRTPGLFVSLLRPPNVTAGATTGLRVAILQERQLKPDAITRQVDLPPDLNTATALGGDPAAAFKSALAVSVAGSAAEAATFADSAYRRLRGQKLAALSSADSGAFIQTVPGPQQPAWQRVIDRYPDKTLLVPPQGTAGALWVIDQATGSATAVLLDGTGGAVSVAQCDNSVLGQLNVAAGMASMVCTVAGYPCLGVTVASIALTAAGIIANEGQVNAGDTWSTTGTGLTALGTILGDVALPLAGRLGLGALGYVMMMASLGCFG